MERGAAPDAVRILVSVLRLVRKNARAMLLLLLFTLIFPMMTAADTMTRFTPKELPYAYDALAPSISAETMHFHHDKHYAGYVVKLNELLAGTPFEGRTLAEIVKAADGPLYNNAAQAWNHEFYFEQFAPDPQRAPEGALAEAVARDFGSVEGLKAAVAEASAALFGSGWVWLAADSRGRLTVVGLPNGDNPLRRALTPLLCFDVWEHAYYIDYRNRRPDAVKAHWDCIDWRVVGARYEGR